MLADPHTPPHIRLLVVLLGEADFHRRIKINDTIVKAVFRFFNHDRAGKEQEYYRVTLEDGGIDSMSTRLPHAKTTDPANQDEYHEVEFSYRKITVENPLAGKSATDDQP